MLDLMRSFSADTLHASFGEKFLSYTPDSRHFSEEFPDTPHAIIAVSFSYWHTWC